MLGSRTNQVRLLLWWHVVHHIDYRDYVELTLGPPVMCALLFETDWWLISKFRRDILSRVNCNAVCVDPYSRSDPTKPCHQQYKQPSAASDVEHRRITRYAVDQKVKWADIWSVCLLVFYARFGI